MSLSSSALNLRTILTLSIVVLFVFIKSTAAIYFPPHIILPAMPLKVVGDPYEETSKLPPRLRCPGIRRCEIFEEDEERINNHLKEINCPPLPICYNRTSTAKNHTTTTALPVNVTTTTKNNTTDSNAAINMTTITADSNATINMTTTNADSNATISNSTTATADSNATAADSNATTADSNTTTPSVNDITVPSVTTKPTITAIDIAEVVAYSPLPPLYALLLCPYLQADLKNETFKQKHAPLLKSIGCLVPASESSGETVTAAAAAAATAAVASDKANVTETPVVAATNETSIVDQTKGAAVNATAVANETNAATVTNGANATTEVDGTNTTAVPAKADVVTTTTNAATTTEDYDDWKRKRALRM